MRRTLLLLVAALLTGACVQQQPAQNSAPAPSAAAGSGDAAFKTTHDKYVVEFLRRNPTVNTYLGGAGLDPSLKDVDGRLRDHSAAALAEEDRWLADSQKAFQGIDAASLSPARKIDRDVALAQIAFLLRQHQTRKYQERAVDTYVSEPFRAIDWQLQGMTQTGEKSYGTPEEWRLVTQRVSDIPRFLQVAQQQLEAGVKSGNTADHRMLLRDGVTTAGANADYFATKLPETARERLSVGEASDQMLKQLDEASQKASEAYKNFAAFVRTTFFLPNTSPNTRLDSGLTPKPEFVQDRYAFGAEEYDWALKNNLRMETTAAKLYEEAWPIVEETRRQMIDVARQIGEKRGMKLPADGPQAVQAVFEELGKDYPKTDAEMVNWYKESGVKLVEYARKTGVFDVPADYKLDVVETPPPLRASIDGAAYYPAPPFKQSGVGRFYVTTSGKDDQAVLKENNRAALADLSAHEGFPGHDWHYKVMTQFRNDITGVRWLTPGAVEDSSSMWEDSMAAEGWALYSEALMAEPAAGRARRLLHARGAALPAQGQALPRPARAHRHRPPHGTDDLRRGRRSLLGGRGLPARQVRRRVEVRHEARELRGLGARHLPLLEVAHAGHHLPPRQRPDLRAARRGVETPRRQVLAQGVPPPLHAPGHHPRGVLP